MKKFIFSSIMLISMGLYAQDNSGKVSGQIVDGNEKTVISATISLLKAKDSSVVKFAVADKNGLFSFDAATGNYLVSVTAVGHSKGFSQVFEVQAGKGNKTENNRTHSAIEVTGQCCDHG
jgi:iron complex outermembrane recepter protein